MHSSLAAGGLSTALAASALALGFRHGLDWDHIAAITDITSSQTSRRRGLGLATLYALGHASVVFTIGVLAIAAGERLPPSLDKVMGRVVGGTLVLLGFYVLYSLARYGRAFRMKSRWMLVFSGARNVFLWLEERLGRRRRRPARLAAPVSGGSGSQFADPFANYGPLTALAVGMLHGVGAETPTQVVIFLTAAGAGGATPGTITLGLFLAGLVAANTLLAVGSSLGYLAASRRFSIYAAVSILTALVSLAVGSAFLAGKETILPALFGG